MKTLKHFNFKMYISTKQNQSFLVASKGIDAETLEDAHKQFAKLAPHIPYHTELKVIERTFATS